MELFTQHIILENTVSLIRGRPPAVVVVVWACLLIFILTFIYQYWKIRQLKWKVYEKQKYIEILEDDKKHSRKIIEILSNQLRLITDNKLIINMSDGMCDQLKNTAQASEQVNIEYQTSEVDSVNKISSCLFTAKARNEKKQLLIVQSLQKSYDGRNDKARAIAKELKRWQEDGYVERNYDDNVVYNELKKILTTMPVTYAGFRKYF